MDAEIKKILLTYNVLSEIKQGHRNKILNESSWAEKQTGLLSGLDKDFQVVIREFQSNMSDFGCFSTFTSGYDTKRKNPDSLHKVGKAVDMRTFDHATTPQAPYLTEQCVSKALQICEKLKAKYPSLYCVHEKTKSQGSEDWSAPHFHIEYGGKVQSDGTNQATTGNDTLSVTPKVDPLIQSVFGGAISKITEPIRQKVQSVASSFLKEQFDFGVNSSVVGNKVIISPSQDKIKSPIKGKLVTRKYMNNCQNQILIKSVNKKFYLLYCGMSDPVKLSGTIYQNEILGKSTTNVEVSLFDDSFRPIIFDSPTAIKITASDEQKYGWGPVDGDSGKTKTRDSNYEKRRQYAEPLVGAVGELLLSPFKAKFWKNLTSTQEKKVNEDLQKIKRLLK